MVAEYESDNPNSIEFADLVTNATMGDAHDSADSALQYVSFDLSDAGVDEDGQHDLLDDLEADIQEVADYVFADGLTVAFQRGETAAAKFVIGKIAEVLGDSPAEQRFIERLRQKEGNIAMMYDSVVHQAEAAAEHKLQQAVVEWGPVV